MGCSLQREPAPPQGAEDRIVAPRHRRSAIGGEHRRLRRRIQARSTPSVGVDEKGTDMTTRLLAALAATTLGAALVQRHSQPREPHPCQPAPVRWRRSSSSTSNSATAVEGTSGDDVIVTGRGSDHVDGRGGRDVICTRGGVDVIRGGKGDDLMRGGRAADQVAGGRGLDRANGGRAPKTSVQPSGRGVASATSAEIQPGGQSSDRLSSCPGLVRVGVHANEYTAELGFPCGTRVRRSSRPSLVTCSQTLLSSTCCASKPPPIEVLYPETLRSCEQTVLGLGVAHADVVPWLADRR